MSKIVLVYVNEFKDVTKEIAVDKLLELIDRIGDVTDVITSKIYKFGEILENEFAERGIRFRTFPYIKAYCMGSAAAALNAISDVIVTVNTDPVSRNVIKKGYIITHGGEIIHVGES